MADVPNFVNAAFANAVPGPASSGQTFARSWFLIQELEHADAVLIATPMHNFTVPAVLKTWTEQVVRIHRAFSNSQAGKVSVLADRPAFVVAAAGGWFSLPSPTGAPPRPDSVTLYLRAILKTIGLRDIHILTLEGVTRGPAMRVRTITDARQSVDRIQPPR